MTTIFLTTIIEAPIEQCFDAARDIDLHKTSAQQTQEKAIAGRTSGLCELHDEVTWEAIHFGIKQRLSVKITQLNKPYFFEDQMTKGAFKNMRHEHHFSSLSDGKTEMLDKFYYEVPYGIFGAMFNTFILKNYMLNFLFTRNTVLKQILEK